VRLSLASDEGDVDYAFASPMHGEPNSAASVSSSPRPLLKGRSPRAGAAPGLGAAAIAVAGGRSLPPSHDVAVFAPTVSRRKLVTASSPGSQAASSPRPSPPLLAPAIPALPALPARLVSPNIHFHSGMTEQDGGVAAGRSEMVDNPLQLG
jgi:hypothetical protein